MKIKPLCKSSNFRYTEHSTVGLAQQWDQLDQLGMRMQHNLEQQIQKYCRNTDMDYQNKTKYRMHGCVKR